MPYREVQYGESAKEVYAIMGVRNEGVLKQKRI